MIGTDNEDNINAGDGNDQITGLGGYDVIDGGNGVDTAIYRGNFEDYTITKSFNNSDDLGLGESELEIKDIQLMNEKNNPRFKHVYDAYESFRSNYSNWNKLSDEAYQKSLELK